MKSVFTYTLSTCRWCRKTKKYFTDHQIPFKYVDYGCADQRAHGPEHMGGIRGDE